jgi:hypothetical protein
MPDLQTISAHIPAGIAIRLYVAKLGKVIWIRPGSAIDRLAKLDILSVPVCPVYLVIQPNAGP